MKANCTHLMIAAAAVAVLALASGCSSVREHRVTERTTHTRDSMTQVTEGYDTWGRRWDEQKTQVREEMPEPAKPRATEIKTGPVTLSKRVPQSVAVGNEFQNELTVAAEDPAGNIVVTDTIPDGAEYLRSDPEATRQGNQLKWTIPAMQKGEVKSMRSYYKAQKEGELSSCCTLAAAPRTCASTFVGRPSLTLAKTGPATAMVGSEVTYTNTVSNTGSLPAYNVVVTDRIPEGLAHSSGQYELTFKVGDLAPKQVKTIAVPLKATQRGNVCNQTIASADNVQQIKAQACTLVLQPGLAVIKTGDPEQFLNRRAAYTITVTNTGDIALKNVAVTDTAPKPTTFVTAEGATVDGQTATWIVPELGPTQSKTFKAVLTSKVAGTYRNEVAAAAMGMRDVAQASTIWRGMAALLIEVVDDNDPVQVGETTTYTIRVTNQGTADASNIGLSMKLSDQVKAVSGEGLTVNGQQMSISKLPTLPPKQTSTYKITVQGVKAGDARLKVTLTADELTTPVVEEESTHVY